MTEVSPGTGVFAFEHTLQEAANKKQSTGVALFLLSVFYTHSMLLEAGSLTNLDATLVINTSSSDYFMNEMQFVSFRWQLGNDLSFCQ